MSNVTIKLNFTRLHSSTILSSTSKSVTKLPESWLVGYQHTSTISDITRISPPNRATRGRKGTLFLDDRAVYFNTATQEWKYTDKTPISRLSFGYHSHTVDHPTTQLNTE